MFADGRVPAGEIVLECGAVVEPVRRGGPPHWPLVLMVKCLLLQKWFGLSDPGLEEMLRDRLSFRRFVGLSLDDDTPDETTFVRFRDRLEKYDRQSTLFDAVIKLPEERGVMLNKGTLVDAGVQQASKGRFSRSADEQSDVHTRDKAASHTRMYGRTYLGFKGHIAADVQGFVKDYRFDTAATHESRYFDRLVKYEQTAVYADKAYRDYGRIEALKERGVFPGIGLRRTRSQAPGTGTRQVNRFAASATGYTKTNSCDHHMKVDHDAPNCAGEPPVTRSATERWLVQRPLENIRMVGPASWQCLPLIMRMRISV